MPFVGVEQIVADWADVGGVAMSTRYVVWYGVRSGDPRTQAQQLVVLDRVTRDVNVLSTAPDPAGLVGWLRISDGWAVWADYTDRSTASDWRVRAARLPNGAASTILQAGRGARLEDRPEFEIRESTLVITARPAGATSQQLQRINLETGARTTLLQAHSDEFLGWPTFDGETVYVGSRIGGTDSVLAVSDIGARASVAPAPVSEPTASKGWLAYKAGERTERGFITIVSRKTPDRVTSPDISEAPASADGVFAWSSGQIETRVFAFDAARRQMYVGAGIPRMFSVGQVAAASGAVAYVTRRLEPPFTSAVTLATIPP